jgi:hypothetical protein
LQFFLTIHHDRTIPGYRLTERFARNKKEPDMFFRGRDRNVITLSIKAYRAVPDRALFRIIKVSLPLGDIGKNSIAALSRMLDKVYACCPLSKTEPN